MKNPDTICWGDTGPRLLAESVRRFNLESQVAPKDTFCPLHYMQYSMLIQDNSAVLLADRLKAAVGLHLWNEMWRLAGMDKNHSYSPSSLYESLKAEYLVCKTWI